MRMDEIGWHHIHNSQFHMHRPDGAGDWLLLLIKSPARIDGCQISSGTLMIYTPEHAQNYGADGMQYIDDWMHFEPAADESALLDALHIPLNTPVTLPHSDSLSNLLREINFEFYSAHHFRQELVDLLFKMLLYQAAEQLRLLSPQKDLAERLSWIHESIYRKPFDTFSTARFAAELSITPEEFETLYQELFDITFESDIRRSIVGYGRKRIQDGDVTDEEAAQLCGYDDTAEFLAQLASFYPSEV